MAIIGGIPRFRAYPTVQSLQSHPGWSISPQPSCWFCFAGSSPRAAAMQVAIHRRKLPAASCEGMDIWVVQNGDWFTKKWQKNNRISWPSCKKKWGFPGCCYFERQHLYLWPLKLNGDSSVLLSVHEEFGDFKTERLVASAEITNCLYIFIVFRRYITWSYVFCCPCTNKPFLLEIQTGLLWVRKRQFVSPNTLHDLKPYWPLAVAVIHKLFLVEIELRMVNRPKPHKKKRKNNVFGTTWI